jgi:MoxR-like ATPase
LDAPSALYEWNYQKQLLAIKARERSDQPAEELERHIFGDDFLLKRPLLRSILCESAPPVLLIDEIDRADEAFEAFLLEILSEFQVTIPELGTIRAKQIPHVVLTSNSTRELSDALKRRCLYHWIDYPSLQKEIEIVRARLPEFDRDLGSKVVRFVQLIRQMNLAKPPGVAETLDLSRASMLLRTKQFDSATAEQMLGCVLKSASDLARIRHEGIENLMSRISQ